MSGSERQLDRHSPLHLVIQVLIDSHRGMSDNEYLDGAGDDYVHIEELEVIRNLLSHSEVSADQLEEIGADTAYREMFS